MNLFKTILAWITGPFTPEVVPMSEVTDPASPAPAPAPAAPAAPVAVAPVDTDKLHAILKVLGHDLELIWDDAVALARKAL